jgi:hypothetical protein
LPSRTSCSTTVAVNVFVMVPMRSESSIVAAAPPAAAVPYALVNAPFFGSQMPR